MDLEHIRGALIKTNPSNFSVAPTETFPHTPHLILMWAVRDIFHYLAAPPRASDASSRTAAPNGQEGIL
jgi:hypothetical protein